MSNKPKGVPSHPDAAYKVGRQHKPRRRRKDVLAKKRKRKRHFWKMVQGVAERLKGA